MPKPLKEQRRRKYMSMRDLAEKANVAVGTIWRIENGAYKEILPRTMRALAIALEIEPSEITEFVIDGQQS